MKIFKWLIRILIAGFFTLIAAAAVLSLYGLSAENGEVSGARSSYLTEMIQQEVQERVSTSPRAAALSQKVKNFVERHSPYGSNWNMNIRKLTHFSIYFLIGSIFYLILSILKLPYGLRWLLCIGACAVLAVFDEMHQGQTPGRVMSATDVLIDCAGAFTSITFLCVNGKLMKWLSSD